ncbi:hypothetical protein [Candidatus Halobonum tyrrellensis]|uniref:Uncharacterized protein n=1 Tax=Candidatus Halobonum tyrrellensis G22 TaxID=1324957 RepID=V4J2P4_9EURY|nr:hypothetical protein [Candidatus Halobonum tyrrellensis]ESP89672.1 hypothetical protein K933_02741 [Candidatus Halobonum tyrrellensis G22]
MKTTRRASLAAVAAGVPLLSGCTAFAAVREGATTPRPDRPVSGAADPVAVRQVFAGTTYEYLPETDEVRYPVDTGADEDGETRTGTVTASGDDPGYATVPFDRWVAARSAAVGADAVAGAVADRVGDHDTVGTAVASTDEGPVIEVEHRGAPPDFDALVAATPGAVTATVVLAGREGRRTHPVRVRRVDGVDSV